MKDHIYTIHCSSLKGSEKVDNQARALAANSRQFFKRDFLLTMVMLSGLIAKVANYPDSFGDKSVSVIKRNDLIF
jgi:hypothetical protein